MSPQNTVLTPDLQGKIDSVMKGCVQVSHDTWRVRSLANLTKNLRPLKVSRAMVMQEAAQACRAALPKALASVLETAKGIDAAAEEQAQVRTVFQIAEAALLAEGPNRAQRRKAARQARRAS